MLNRRLLFQFMIFKKIEKKQGEEFSELSALLFVYCNDRFPMFSVVSLVKEIFLIWPAKHITHDLIAFLLIY